MDQPRETACRSKECVSFYDSVQTVLGTAKFSDAITKRGADDRFDDVAGDMTAFDQELCGTCNARSLSDSMQVRWPVCWSTHPHPSLQV